MPTPPLDRSVYIAAARLIAEHGGNVSAAGAASGMNRNKFNKRAENARAMGLWGRDGQGGAWYAPEIGEPERKPVPTAAPLPDDDLPTGELIDFMVRRFEKRKAHSDAKRWRRFTVPVAGPYALMIFGDPHIDDNGCDWGVLKAHCDLASRTEALFAVNLGDTTNNWAGRLARLWAEQDTSSATARKLVKWLLNDSGVPWWLWLQGNHDLWPGPVGGETLERFKPQAVTLEDWGAKVTLVSPGGSEFRLHVAHDFAGHSMWNPLHGPQKAALMGDQAHLYAAGHKHNWALFQGEHEHRRTLYWLARARGYKVLDHYGEVLGFGSQQHGHSILAVINPGAAGPAHVNCFADPFEGVDYLRHLRARAA